MRKVVVTILFALVAMSLSFAATSGSVGVSGSIAAHLDVVVTATTSATALDPSTTTTGVTVGDAVFSTNNKAWKIALYSTNGSKLKHSDVAVTDFVGYTFSLGSLLTGATLPTAAPTTPQISMTGKTAAAGDSYPMVIIYTGVSNLTAGTYADTIYVSVSAP